VEFPQLCQRIPAPNGVNGFEVQTPNDRFAVPVSTTEKSSAIAAHDQLFLQPEAGDTADFLRSFFSLQAPCQCGVFIQHDPIGISLTSSLSRVPFVTSKIFIFALLFLI
jgi:hypothetical protein